MKFIGNFTYMKPLLILCVSTLFFSCTSTPENLSIKKIALANFSLEIDTALKYQETNANMAMAKIIGENIAPIVLFNFGNKPISLKANIERWKGQLSEVQNEIIETYHDDLIYYIELEGLDNKAQKTFLLSAIIPSDDGPYYFKSTCTKDDLAKTKFAMQSTLKSIDY